MLVICGITSSVLVLIVLNILPIHHFQTLIGFASYNACLRNCRAVNFLNWILHGQNKGNVLQQFNAGVLEAIEHSQPCNGV